VKTLLDYRHLLLEPIAEAMDGALVLLGPALEVVFMNHSARQILGLKNELCIGRPFFEHFHSWTLPEDTQNTVLHAVLRSGQPQRHLSRMTPDGRSLSVNIVPIQVGDALPGVLITAEDVTHLMDLEQELDLAFALTLPNSKVEYRLKSVPEYKDHFDSATGTIVVTGVIEDGGYRHVVNCLKLFSQLTAHGVTRLIGIEKDDLVQVFVYHDLGKSQPPLRIGDVVDPKVAFEQGKLHADRSADIAKHLYGQKDEIVEIIRYHHHSEAELPDSFPKRLLPMFRLFQIIDGTSAAITRGGVDVDFKVVDCTVEVCEVNHRPAYNGTRRINLYTGEREWIPSDTPSPQ